MGTCDSKTLTKARFKVKSDHQLQLTLCYIAKVTICHPFYYRKSKGTDFFPSFIWPLMLEVCFLLSSPPCSEVNICIYLKWTLVILFIF